MVDAGASPGRAPPREPRRRSHGRDAAAAPELAVLPTPLRAGTRGWTEALGSPGRCWVKRDDLTGFAVAGNKARAARVPARRRGRARAPTSWSPAAAPARTSCRPPPRLPARRAGLRLLVSPGAAPAAPHPNLALAAGRGAPGCARPATPTASRVDDAARRASRRARGGAGRGRTSCRAAAPAPVGALGYALRRRRARRPARPAGVADRCVVVAAGSGGTLAGLVAGQVGSAAARVVGASVSRPADEVAARRARAGPRGAPSCCGEPRRRRRPTSTSSTRAGPGTASPSARTTGAAPTSRCARDGLVLDPSTRPRRSTLLPAARQASDAGRVLAHRRRCAAAAGRADASGGRRMTARVTPARSGPPRGPAARSWSSPASRWRTPTRRCCTRAQPGRPGARARPAPARASSREHGPRELLALLLEVDATAAEDFPYDPAYGEPYNSRERYFVAQHRRRRRLAARRAARGARRCGSRCGCTCAASSLDLVARPPRLAEASRDWPRRARRTWMPDQTYLQHAQPSTFGHYLLSFAYPVLRDARRGCWTSWPGPTPAPAAPAASTAAGCSTTAARSPALLGFDGVIEHTRDAMWQTDGLVDMLAIGGQPASDAEQARRGPGDLGQQRVRLRRPRRRLQPVERADAAEAQPLLAVDHPRRVRHPDRPADRLPRGDQEPVGAQRQPHLRLRRGAARARPGRADHPADDGVVRTLRVNADRMWAALERGFMPGHRPGRVRHADLRTGLPHARTRSSATPCARRAGAGLRGGDHRRAMLDAAAPRADRHGAGA